MTVAPPPIAPIEASIFDDDDEGWQDMPIVRDSDDHTLGLDEEDQKKYKYVPPAKKEASTGASNARGNVLDVDVEGVEWRTKADQNESEYTRLRMNEEDESDEVSMRTRYLFDEDKAMTPLSQMQATKDLLTEAQRVAYVGLCALTTKEMAQRMRDLERKELNNAIKNMELWALKIMGRLYYHMELATEEQKMIESLSLHGIEAKDLVPSLMTTHTVANPEYDPAEASKEAERQKEAEATRIASMEVDSEDIARSPDTPQPTSKPTSPQLQDTQKQVQTTLRVLEDTTTSIPGVSTHLSTTEKDVTLDIRWTVLCDLFLILIADSVYDARSRVLLEQVALKLGLGWLDVVKFERRVTEALEIQEEVENLEQREIIESVKKNSRRKRYMMLGLATLGGGLVIGLSAGLLAPVIGAGLGAAFTTIGITGTTGFLAGAGGAAVITTGGVLTGSGIAAKGMAKRTQYVRTFDLLPLHNNKRVNCILTVPGFMNGKQDDVRLPFSVLDPVVGDVFSVLWEPEMIRETGSALRILTGEVLTQLAQTALQATVMTALMSALQWPIILTKLGYLIDNPWNNALDRARAAGSVLADILIHRHLGVRPITLIGFSLGSRVIFYALLELAKQKQYGIVQDVIILGTTVTAPTRTWIQTRSVVSGRYVNGYARNDWVLNYLFRATSGGLNTVAGLRPVEGVPGLENVDVTDKIAGHMSYRTFMPLILDQLGFPVFADYFDEPEEPDFEGERIVVKEGEQYPKKKSWFSLGKRSSTPSIPKASRPPSATSGSFQRHKKSSSSASSISVGDDLPPRMETPPPGYQEKSSVPGTPTGEITEARESNPELPKYAGFDLKAIQEVVGTSATHPEEQQIPAPVPIRIAPPTADAPTHRSESVPLGAVTESPSATPRARSSLDLPGLSDNTEPIAGPSTTTSYRDLSSNFSRSMSLNSLRDESAEDMTSPYSKTPSINDYGVQPPPTLSFAGADGSVSSLWPASPEKTPSYSSFSSSERPSYSSFQIPEASFGTGNGFNSFGSRSPSLFAAPDSAGMSFGGMDGSITLSPSPQTVERDPWDIPSPSFGEGNSLRSKKSPATASTLNLNPWSN